MDILQFYICWCQTFASLPRCCCLSSYTREIESGELWDLIKSYVPRLVLLCLEPRLINHLAVGASYNLQKLLDYFNIPLYKRKTYFLFHPHYILFLMEMSNAFFAKANWFNYNGICDQNTHIILSSLSHCDFFSPQTGNSVGVFQGSKAQNWYHGSVTRKICYIL